MRKEMTIPVSWKRKLERISEYASDAEMWTEGDRWSDLPKILERLEFVARESEKLIKEIKSRRTGV